MQKHGVMFPLLDGVLRAVNEIDGKHYSLDDILDNSEIIPTQMRRTASHWLFSIYRYRVDIEKFIRNFAKKGKIKKNLFNLAVVSVAHSAFQNSIARELSVNAIVEYAKVKLGISESRFINALLRSFCREKIEFRSHLPQDLQQRWSKIFGADFIAQAEQCMAAEALQSFRLRPGFEMNIDNAQKISGNDFKYLSFYKIEKIEEIIESGLFKQGGIYIQDSATGFAVELLKKYVDKENGRFIDVCGAPGGKAIMFHDLFPAWKISIGDRSAKRHERTKENLKRCGIEADLTVCDASIESLKQKYDVIFADVPCSNSGVFRKRPDALYRLNDDNLREIAGLQQKILENICSFVTDGGLLLYSTCSIENAEDSLQIKNFCQRHDEFELLEERLILPDIDHDGAYCACLRRKNDC